MILILYKGPQGKLVVSLSRRLIAYFLCVPLSIIVGLILMGV